MEVGKCEKTHRSAAIVVKVTSWRAMLIQWIARKANWHHTRLRKVFIFLPPFSCQTSDADFSTDIAQYHELTQQFGTRPALIFRLILTCGIDALTGDAT